MDGLILPAHSKSVQEKLLNSSMVKRWINHWSYQHFKMPVIINAILKMLFYIPIEAHNTHQMITLKLQIIKE